MKRKIAMIAPMVLIMVFVGVTFVGCTDKTGPNYVDTYFAERKETNNSLASCLRDISHPLRVYR